MPLIVHRYLTKTYTNPQPPGFADFLRGTIALYQLSIKNKYDLKVDINSHPIFKFLDIPKDWSISIEHGIPTVEILPPIGYEAMHRIIESNLNNADLLILTNAFYNENQDMTCEYSFIRSILTPTSTLSIYIDAIKNSLQLNDQYIVIHARIGDNFLVYKNDVQENIVNRIRNYITQIIANTAQPVLFIADSYQLKNSVKDLCKITEINPIHTGSLDIVDIDERLLATLSEFFIMSKASAIYCLNFYDGSGYSKICSKIYSIDYHCLPL